MPKLTIKFENGIYKGLLDSGIKKVPERLVRVGNTKEEIVDDFRIRFHLSDAQVEQLQSGNNVISWSIEI